MISRGWDGPEKGPDEHFKSLEEIRQASVEELMEIPEMNERTAEEIVTFFCFTDRTTCGTLKDNEKGGGPGRFFAEKVWRLVWQV